MTTVRLQMGRHSNGSGNLAYKVVQDCGLATVRESNYALPILRQLEEIVSDRIDENLKPQYEILLSFEREGRGYKPSVDFRWVPDSGCDSVIAQAGHEIFASLKSMIMKKWKKG